MPLASLKQHNTVLGSQARLFTPSPVAKQMTAHLFHGISEEDFVPCLLLSLLSHVVLDNSSILVFTALISSSFFSKSADAFGAVQCKAWASPNVENQIGSEKTH